MYLKPFFYILKKQNNHFFKMIFKNGFKGLIIYFLLFEVKKEN